MVDASHLQQDRQPQAQKTPLLQRLSRSLPTARESAVATDGDLMRALCALSGAPLDEVALCFFDDLDLRHFTGMQLRAYSPEFSQISFTDCVAHSVYPARIDGQMRFIVTDPWDATAVQWLSHKTSVLPTLGWASHADIQTGLQHAQQTIKASSELVTSTVTPTALHGESGIHLISIETIERSTSPIVRFVDAAIYDAWKTGASDIHFECDRQGVRVKLRLDGVLVPTAELAERARAEEVISRIKVLAQLDIAERRVPQDGRFRVALGERELDFRVSVMPSIFGEDAVVRLLDKSQLRGNVHRISLASLGLDADAILRIRRLAKKPHGMLLVTGPTGSGKTTTLYAALSEIQNEQEKIITIEDPVEYELPGVLQIPVNEKKGLTFSQGLRSILRHDPDKILVGEIRDAETAEIAVQAALTGHLVLTTVHANSVFDVISRFLHMNLDLYSLISALNGIVAQRLIRCNCPQCAEDEAASPELQGRLMAAGLRLDTASVKRGRGCAHCRKTGYKGRLAIAEVLPVDDTLRTLILKRADVIDIKQHALEMGIQPLADRALAAVAAGLTTLEEIDRVVAHD